MFINTVMLCHMLQGGGHFVVPKFKIEVQAAAPMTLGRHVTRILL